MVKKVPEDSDWLFGDNIVSRINQIKARQQALTSDGFKNSKKLQGFCKNPENRQNGYYQNQPRQGQNRSNYYQSQQRKLSPEEEHIQKQINKYELITKLTSGNTKNFASFPLRISSVNVYPQFSEDLVTFTEEILNGKLHFLCKLDFTEFPKNSQYQFRTLMNNRSIHPDVFLGKGVLNICSKFTAPMLKREFNKVAFALQHGCCLVNLLHIFRTPFPKNTSGRLHLE